MKKALVFYMTFDNKLDPSGLLGYGRVYILTITSCISGYEIEFYTLNIIKRKRISPNIIQYIIQNHPYSVPRISIPLELSRVINNLFSINFSTEEITNRVKDILQKESIKIFGNGRSVKYIYELNL